MLLKKDKMPNKPLFRPQPPVNDPNPADETVPCSMQCPTRCTIRFRPGTVIKRRLAMKPARWRG